MKSGRTKPALAISCEWNESRQNGSRLIGRSVGFSSLLGWCGGRSSCEVRWAHLFVPEHGFLALTQNDDEIGLLQSVFWSWT